MSEIPLELIVRDVNRVKMHKSPLVDPQDLLKAMHLDGPDADGLTLMDRLVPEEFHSLSKPLNLSKGIGALRKIEPLIKDLMYILYDLHENKQTQEEEQLVKNLSLIAIAQLQREGDICPVATFLSIGLLSVRPNLFPNDLKMQLSEAAFRNIILPLAIEKRRRDRGYW